jgi:hypothetical protein
MMSGGVSSGRATAETGASLSCWFALICEEPGAHRLGQCARESPGRQSEFAAVGCDDWQIEAGLVTG